MGLAHAVTLVFWFALAALAFGIIRRARLWAAGAPAPVVWLDILKVPRRYFHDVHHIVARDPYIARTHIAVAGGAVAAVLLAGINYGFALYAKPLDALIVMASLVMLTGAGFAWYRRQKRPARLSAGSWDRLPWTLAAFAAGLALIAMTNAHTASQMIALAAFALVLIGGSELALGIGLGGPMKHAVAGLLHLAFHPRRERFDGRRSTALKPLALEANDFGIRSPSDFQWNQLLGFDACVQCGKCETACPAFAAGQPLNPKKLIQDLVAGFSSASDAEYAGSPYPGKERARHTGDSHEPVVPSLIGADTLWSCTTCRACVEECPMMIEHVDAIIGLRRNLNLAQGEAPGKAAETLGSLRETGTQSNETSAARYRWAADLGLKIAQPGVRAEYLLIAGEGAFDDRYQRTLRALIRVLQSANVDFAILGDEERDCGDAARRLGDEATFQSLAKRNINVLSKYKFGTILTADPHVFHSLKNEYPAFGSVFDVVHHTELLASLIQNKKIHLDQQRPSASLTYHDPCYLGRYNGAFEPPREVLRALGFSIREMQRSGPRARCCGGGGGAPLTDIPGERRIADMRMADAKETSAQVLAVACPQCTAMLEGVTGDRPQVFDIAELVAARLVTGRLEEVRP